MSFGDLFSDFIGSLCCFGRGLCGRNRSTNHNITCSISNCIRRSHNSFLVISFNVRPNRTNTRGDDNKIRTEFFSY